MSKKSEIIEKLQLENIELREHIEFLAQKCVRIAEDIKNLTNRVVIMEDDCPEGFYRDAFGNCTKDQYVD